MALTHRPQQLRDALQLMNQHTVTVMAGGTDIYPAHVGRSVKGTVLDISALSELSQVRSIAVNGEVFLELGAALTWTSLVRRRDPLLRSPWLDGLVMAAAEVGGVQIQNRGTLAGNLCNASPAADGVPALMALDASVVLISIQGERVLPLHKFITGPRQTALMPNELVRAIRLPVPMSTDRSHAAFLKLGHRRYLVISAVMVAARLDWRDNRVAAAAIAVGSCSPVAIRLPALENDLLGQSPANVIALSGRPLPGATLSALSPISDLRGSDHY
ncbi:MAG: FAD binding domain-containing protein, partial [Burkholderiaceae bacterium]